MYWRSVRWWSELTGPCHLSRALHGGVRTAKIYQELNGQENSKHPPALRLQKASLPALASFRLATRYALRGKRKAHIPQSVRQAQLMEKAVPLQWDPQHKTHCIPLKWKSSPIQNAEHRAWADNRSVLWSPQDRNFVTVPFK